MGTDEHLHAAMAASRMFSLRTARLQRRSSKRPPICSYPLVPALLPGRKPSEQLASRQASTATSTSATSHTCRKLKVLLESIGLGHMSAAFAAEGVTVEDLATAGPSWLKTYFPDIKASAAKRLLEKAASICSSAAGSPANAACVPASSVLEAVEPPVKWLLNVDTGVAHPTLDGQTPSCGHACGVHNIVPANTCVGLKVCPFAARKKHV